MNIGHSSRLLYDDNVYPDKLVESQSPLTYRMNVNQIRNCNRCLSTLGPRSRFGVSTLGDLKSAESQDLADLESIFTNRNVKTSKSKLGHVNPVNPLDNQQNLSNNKFCGNAINPEHSRLSYPAQNYRNMSVNRFYNLIHDPQENLFWNFSINTKLEAKDNFKPNIPNVWPELAGPKEDKNGFKPCVGAECNNTKLCPTKWAT